MFGLLNFGKDCRMLKKCLGIIKNNIKDINGI